MKKITIIGSGKLAYALACGFVRAQENNLLVVGRSEKDRNKFESLGIKYSSNIEEGINTSFLILSVIPKGAVPVLRNLAILKEKNLLEFKTIISFVSGVDNHFITKIINIKESDVVLATTNTNIAYNCGIICLLKTSNQKAVTLLKNLGEVIFENNIKMLCKAIAFIGSMNAFDAVTLMHIYAYSTSNVSLYCWLKKIKSFLRNKETNNERSLVLMFCYLEAKYEALNMYPYGKRSDMVYITLQSTIDSLLVLGEGIDEKSIQILIKSVVTKGGCTEQGITRLCSITEVIDPNILKEVYKKVWQRARLFYEEVRML